MFSCPSPFPHVLSSQLLPPPAPLALNHSFLLLISILTPALVGASVSMKQFPPLHFLGKSWSTRRAGSPLPTQVCRVGAGGVAAAGSRGQHWDGCQCTCSCPGPHAAVFAQSWLDSDGKSKTFRVPKITFPTDFEALFGNIRAPMNKPCTGK